MARAATTAPVFLSQHQGLNTGVDVLSDTMGVDFDPYLRKIIREIYNTWLPLIPEEARPPLNKQGETLIRFTILPDGRIGAMNIDASTQDTGARPRRVGLDHRRGPVPAAAQPVPRPQSRAAHPLSRQQAAE